MSSIMEIGDQKPQDLEDLESKVDADLVFSEEEGDAPMPKPLPCNQIVVKREDDNLRDEKVLVPGTRIEAVIVSVLNPAEFYYVSENSQKWMELQTEVDAYASDLQLHPPPLEELVEHTTKLIVFSDTFNKWCRAHFVLKPLVLESKEANSILSRVAANVICYLEDYHYNDNVSYMNIRAAPEHLINPEKYRSLARRGQLAGVAPLSKWDLHSNEHMKQLVLHKPVTLFVQKPVYDAGDLFYQYTVGFKLDGVAIPFISLKDALITAGYARKLPTESRIDSQLFVGENFKPFNLPSPRDVFTGVISFIQSPDLFFVNRAADSERLLKQQDEIQTFYQAHSDSLKIHHIYDKMSCVAKYSEDGNFCRAQVVSITLNQRRAEVQFIDYGNSETCVFDQIFYVAQQFMENEKLCLPCCMGTIEPVKSAFNETGFNWGKNATDHFMNVLAGDDMSYSDSHLAVRVWGLVSSNSKVNVTLHKFTPDDREIDIAKSMIEKQFAVAKDYDDENREKLENQLSSENISCYIILKDIQERQVTAKSSKKESLIPVGVLNAVSPDEFYVQLQEKSVIRMLRQFYARMSECVNTLSASQELKPLENRAVGTIFVFKARFTDGDSWRRAKILDVEQSEDGQQEFNIITLEVAESFKLRIHQMFELPEKFKTNDPFAIKCRIEGVRPAGGDKWSGQAVDNFKGFCKKYKGNLFILLKETLTAEKKEPILVNLISITKATLDPFLPSKITYHTVADLLVGEWGVAFSDRESGGISDHDELNEVPQKCEIVSTPRITRGPKKIRESSLYTRLLSLVPDEIDPKSAFFYRAAESPPGSVFRGLVTNVDDDANIYFQLVTGIRMKVLEVNSAISKGVVEQLPGYMGAFTKNRACTAKFSYDDTYNRAKILGTVTGGNHLIRICFVDYGNEGLVFLEDISSKIFAKEVPELAIKAKLFGCKIFKDERQGKVKEVLGDMLLDKTCEFTWVVSNLLHPKKTLTIMICRTTRNVIL